MSGMTGPSEEEMLSARALFNDEGFHQYTWMSDLSLFGNDLFGATRF